MQTVNTKKALDETITAMVALHAVKAKLGNIHSHLKQRDDTQFVLDNIGRFCTPSDDAHEVVFERLQAAKEMAELASREDERRLVLDQLTEAYFAIERAYKSLKA